jgi:hypothetical protein
MDWTGRGQCIMINEIRTIRFDNHTDLSNIRGDFNHLAIEVNHPTTI